MQKKVTLNTKGKLLIDGNTLTNFKMVSLGVNYKSKSISKTGIALEEYLCTIFSW